jgi:GPH family glycoside/pentoside/hexuronide:cation symporter
MSENSKNEYSAHINKAEMSRNEMWSWSMVAAGVGLLNYLINGYMAYFFTDVMLIPAASLVTIMFIARVLDGIQDIGIGMAIDRTRRKDGQCRPFYKWFALPYLAGCILLFLNPSFPSKGKLIYAAIVYINALFMFSFIQVPLGAQTSLMTKNSKEISVISGMRFLVTNILSIVFGLVVLQLLTLFGRGDMNKGFTYMGVLVGVIGAAGCLWAYTGTRDRYVAPLPEKTGIPLVGQLKYLKNFPWFIALIATLGLMLSYGMNSAMAIYYFTYVMPNQTLSSFALVVVFLFMIPSGILAAGFGDRFGKKRVVIMGILTCITGKLIMLIAGRFIPGPAPIFVGLALSGYGLGTAIPLMSSLMPDIVDYGEWKNGASTPGILNSAISLATKLGGGLATSIALLLLSRGGYDPNLAAQPDSAIRAITGAYILLPLLCDIISLVFIGLYRIYGKRDKILQDLAERHAAQVL